MSYATGNCRPGEHMSLAENHEKVCLQVYDIAGCYVENVVRTVMSTEGQRYVTYKRQRYQVKKLREVLNVSLVGTELPCLKVKVST